MSKPLFSLFFKGNLYRVNVTGASPVAAKLFQGFQYLLSGWPRTSIVNRSDYARCMLCFVHFHDN